METLNKISPSEMGSEDLSDTSNESLKVHGGRRDSPTAFKYRPTLDNKSCLDSENEERIVLITDNILSAEEEERERQEQVVKQTEEGERTQQDKAEEKLEASLRQKRLQELNSLLTKSEFYTKFILSKIKDNQEKLERKRIKDAQRIENLKKSETKEQQSVKRETRNASDNHHDKASRKRKAASPLSGKNARRWKRLKVEQESSESELEEQSVEQRAAEKEERQFNGQPIDSRQPRLFTGGIMRSYQLDGFEWLRVMYENGVNGILADEMGLGKTIQVIALVAHLVEMEVPGPFLICAPLSTLPNWMSEFNKFTPELPVIQYHGLQHVRMDLRKKMAKMVSLNGKKIYNICVTSYEMLMIDRSYLSNFPWRLIVIDEGHRIKNQHCRLVKDLKLYHSTNRMLLTGTPLQNNLAELWSLLNFLIPEIFDKLQIFESWFDVEELNEEGASERIAAQEQEQQVLSTLQNILSPFMLRRLKADVDLQIPAKREIMVYCPLSEKQQTFYKATVDRTILILLGKFKEDVVVEDGERKPRRSSVRAANTIARCAEALTKDDDSFFDWQRPWDRSNYNEAPDNQAIVNVRMQNVMMQLRKCCNHPYLLEYPLDPATGFFKVDEDLVANSGKLMVVDAMLEKLKRTGHKVLLFCQMTKMMDIFEDFCQLRKYKYSRLDGTMKVETRKDEMDTFNSDPDVFLFLLSTRAGGQGLNLTAADTVILYDSDWNPQCDIQAMDRCHRIGQTRPVLIYRLVTANTIDQKVVERAAGKRKLERMLMATDKYKVGHQGLVDKNKPILSKDDFLQLLKESDHQRVVKTSSQVLTSEELDRLLDRSELEHATKGKKAGVQLEEGIEGVFKVLNTEIDQDDVDSGKVREDE